jgi:hypothetical protein
MIRNDLHPVTDSTCRASGGIRALLGKKAVETLDVSQRLG